MVRRFATTVTFQEAVPGRTPAGEVIADSYENVEGLADLPARIVAHVAENVTDRMTVTSDLFDIYVQGDQPVRPEMVCLSSDAVYDVKSVANPTIHRPMSLVTVVTAELVSL